MGTVSFFREFLRSPGTVGAVAPSSRGLARMMVHGIDFNTVDALAEYGAGTGVFTGEIVRNMHGPSKFVSFEINPTLRQILQGHYPGVSVVEKSVLDLPDVLQEHGIAQLDHIVSGLPFAVFSAEDQENILRLSAEALKPGGTFRTFAYLQGTLLPAGVRFRKLLDRHFSEVRKTPVVWRNLPPAFVYVCRV